LNSYQNHRTITCVFIEDHVGVCPGRHIAERQTLPRKRIYSRTTRHLASEPIALALALACPVNATWKLSAQQPPRPSFSPPILPAHALPMTSYSGHVAVPLPIRTFSDIHGAQSSKFGVVTVRMAPNSALCSLSLPASAHSLLVLFLFLLGLYQLILAHGSIGTKHVLEVVQRRVMDSQSRLRRDKFVRVPTCSCEECERPRNAHNHMHKNSPRTSHKRTRARTRRRTTLSRSGSRRPRRSRRSLLR